MEKAPSMSQFGIPTGKEKNLYEEGVARRKKASDRQVQNMIEGNSGEMSKEEKLIHEFGKKERLKVFFNDQRERDEKEAKEENQRIIDEEVKKLDSE